MHVAAQDRLREAGGDRVSVAASPSVSASAAIGRRLLRGGGWALFGRALALPVGLALAMLLARLLPPAELGAYFLATSLVALLVIVAQGGLARPMVKLVAAALATDRPEAARRAVRLAFVVTVLGGAIIGVAVADGPGRLLTGALRDGAVLQPVLWAIGALVLIAALVDLCVESLRGFHDLRSASLLGDTLAQRLLLIIGLMVAWLAARPIGLWDVLAAAVLCAAVVLVAALLLLRRRLAAIGRHGAPWRDRDVLRHGPPFMLVRLNLWLLAGADLWILALFRPPEEVALYGAASRLALLVGIPLTICNAALAPMVAEFHSQGRLDRLEKVVRATATLSALPALALVGLFALFGAEALELVYTSAYAEGYAIVVVLALGQWLHVVFGSCAISLTMTGHQRDVMLAGIATSVGTVLGYAAAAPGYGALGVALVTAASLAAYNLVLAWLARKRLGISTWVTVSPVALRRCLAVLRGA